ncbi:uncharacterized protein LOC135204114 [Macrobrachium nipponense]|uniref:uncharacterized protein LOC135204114 n=1 Tax=Macrobrachium nipponense TaxID=159736 RepID=UPI0030C848A8
MVQSVGGGAPDLQGSFGSQRQFRHSFHHHHHHNHQSRSQDDVHRTSMNTETGVSVISEGNSPADGGKLSYRAKVLTGIGGGGGGEEGGGGGSGGGQGGGGGGNAAAKPSKTGRTLESGTHGSPPVIRLLVLGGHGVGKSAITVRYLTRRFIGEYKSQVDIIYRQTIQIDGFKVDLEIIDISSRPGDDTLPTLEICQCDCYLVVYSVAERHTFLTANHLLRAIFKLRPHVPTPPITLLGNKQDLEHSRQVSREEGESTSKAFGCDFAEVSVAETSEDIVPIFMSLLRRAKTYSCLCLHSSRALLDLTSSLNRPASGPLTSSTPLVFSSHSSTCYCSCQHTFLIDSQTCRHCGCSDLLLVKGTPLIRTGSVNISRYSENERFKTLPSRVRVTRQASERSYRKVSRNNSKRQTSRTTSSPQQKEENKESKTSGQLNKLNKKLIDEKLFSTGKSEKGDAQKGDIVNKPKDELKVPNLMNSGPRPLTRSLSSPEDWSQKADSETPCALTPKTAKNKKAEGFFASLESQNPNLSLLSRGRSFILNTSKSKRNFECSCSTQNRTGSFKSSGKVEIVTIKTPKLGGKEDPLASAAKEETKTKTGRPNLPTTSKKFKNGSIGPLQGATAEANQAQAAGTSTSKNQKQKKAFQGLDPLDTKFPPTADASVSPTTAVRQRKFSVFGRALGNFLSKGSLPDLPRATANICDKFGSLKKTIKKRSV